MIRDQQALDYHQIGRPGKLEVVSSKPCNSQRDLSLAYTPGVAVPCRRIQKKPEEAYLYTGRGNLVAVISNGIAVLGLGNIGPLAGKPVMEGKAVCSKGLLISTCSISKSMAPDPILFAMANPDPEIDYDAARDARPDAIMATGRSDYPNQVNNVLGFPFIFRGALDVRAKAINEEMKLAATQALAALATEYVPDSVLKAYGLKKLHFGRHRSVSGKAGRGLSFHSSEKCCEHLDFSRSAVSECVVSTVAKPRRCRGDRPNPAGYAQARQHSSFGLRGRGNRQYGCDCDYSSAAVRSCEDGDLGRIQNMCLTS